MHQRLFITIIVLSIFAWYINSFSPSDNWRIALFLGFAFLSLLFISLTILNQLRLSLIISLGATIYLTLRLWNLTHPFYLLILILSCVSLELTLKNR